MNRRIWFVRSPEPPPPHTWITKSGWGDQTREIRCRGWLKWTGWIGNHIDACQRWNSKMKTVNANKNWQLFYIDFMFVDTRWLEIFLISILNPPTSTKIPTAAFIWRLLMIILIGMITQEVSILTYVMYQCSYCHLKNRHEIFLWIMVYENWFTSCLAH